MLRLALALCALLPGPLTLAPGEAQSTTWREDPVWHDGKAEVCVYQAERVIYGKARRYQATVYTNVQRMDPESTVKLDTGSIEVFKHHWSERIPTEQYDYDFSTAVFLDASNLRLFKLTCSTQDGCGASFKQLWRVERENHWIESVYFPGAGLKQGRFGGLVVAEDSLSLFLRQFPFSRGIGTKIKVQLLPSQKDTHRVQWNPIPTHVTLLSTGTIDLPIGKREAHHLRLGGIGHAGADFWFATDGTAPVLHALLAYEDSRGNSYRLETMERTAYWEH